MSDRKESWKAWRWERREVIWAWREAGVGVGEVAVMLGAALVVALLVGSGDGCSTSWFGVAKGLLSVWVESASASSWSSP